MSTSLLNCEILLSKEIGDLICRVKRAEVVERNPLQP